MTDLKLIQTLSGGELVQLGNDLATVHGIENTPFLAMFGGTDWCGNFLTDKPFNARTEKKLATTPLSSAGRAEIEDTVRLDMAYLNDIPGTVWDASVTITGPKKVDIGITINGVLFSYLWNPNNETDENIINDSRIHSDDYGDEYD